MISVERKCWILIFKFRYTFFAGHPVERENWLEIRLETILLAIHCFEHFSSQCLLLSPQTSENLTFLIP